MVLQCGLLPLLQSGGENCIFVQDASMKALLEPTTELPNGPLVILIPIRQLAECIELTDVFLEVVVLLPQSQHGSERNLPFCGISELPCERSVEFIPTLLVVWVLPIRVRWIGTPCPDFVRQGTKVAVLPMIDIWPSDKTQENKGALIGVGHGRVVCIHLPIEAE
jgi:hypothetical protein